MARAFEALIEQIDQTASSWEPVNENGEVAAQEMRQMVADAPRVFEAFAQMWSAMAGKCTDQIWLEAGAADALHTAASYCKVPADQLRETAKVVDRPHGAELDALQRGPTQAAWSWERNQGNYTA